MELQARQPNQIADDFLVSTYRARIGVVLGAPKLLLHVLRLRRYIRRNDISTVIGAMEHVWQSLAVPFAIPKDVVYIASIHDAVSHPGERHPVKRIGRQLELRRADGIVTFSSEVRDLLVAGTRIRVPIMRTVLPAFSQSDRPIPSARALPSGRPIRIGFFGRLEPYKGLDVFVQVIDTLVERGWPVEGIISGSPARNWTGHEALMSGPNVSWRIAWIDESEVNSVVASYDVVLLPYSEASQSGVVGVALAEAVPFVVTPVGGLREQAEETGAGVVADDSTVTGVANAVESILSSAYLYERLSKAGAAAACDGHSWEALAGDYTSFLRRLHASTLPMLTR